LSRNFNQGEGEAKMELYSYSYLVIFEIENNETYKERRKNLLKEIFLANRLEWNDNVKVENSNCYNCDSCYTIKTNDDIEIVYKRLLNKVDGNIDKVIVVYADKIRRQSPIKSNIQKVEDNFVSIASFSF
jgi:hypothetical protein